MATNAIKVLIDTVVKGANQVKDLNKDLAETGKAGEKASVGMGGLGVKLGAVTLAIGAAVVAGKQLYSFLKNTADVERMEIGFGNLAASIGSTADALLYQMKYATAGTMSEIALMTTATDLMATGLAKDTDTVIRLSRVVGLLGLDMNQLVLELNTMKGMRLDQLGLDRTVVMAKKAQLELTGMSETAAYTEAVLSAAEAKIGLAGDVASTSAGSFQRFEAALADTKKTGGELALTMFEAAGGINALEAAADGMRVNQAVFDMLKKAYEEGAISAGDYAQAIIYMGVAAGGGKELYDYLAVSQGRVFTATKGSTEATYEFVGSLTDAMASAAMADAVMLTLATGIDYVGDSALVTAGKLDAARSALSKFHARQAALEGLAGKAAIGAIKTKLGLDAVSMSAGRATASLGGYGAALDETTEKQRRFADAFTAELGTGVEADNEALRERQKIIDQGLVGDDGMANMVAINAALYDQAKAAGASAGQLALLGIATGEFSEEQAKAALKAALLQEKIAQMAKAVTAGDISYSDAIGNIGGFAAELDTAAAQSSVEELATAVDQYATGGPYAADVDANTATANSALQDVIKLLDDIDGRKVSASVNITQSGNVASTSNPDGTPTAADGGQFRRGQKVWVGEEGPELITMGFNGRIWPTGTGPQESGPMWNVVVNNYVDGRPDPSAVDTITVDRMKRALRSLGV